MRNSQTGTQLLIESMLAHGVDHVFGNPGTTELPLLDGLMDCPQISYILALHEAVAVTMADAYATATGHTGVVNLHVGPGLGNGLGSVYDSWEGRTPLLITAGQQDTRMRLREPLLGHDLVAMAEPLVKWSVEAASADELPLILHRAFKITQQAPKGPVFVALPMNVLVARGTTPMMAPSKLYTAGSADLAGIAQAVEWLAAARQPVIIAGDGVASEHAGKSLQALAELLGAAVHLEILPSRLCMPNLHDCFRGRMPQDQAMIRERLGEADVVLLVGGEFFEEVWFADSSPFPEQMHLIHVDSAPAMVGRNYRVDCGIVAPIKATLEALVSGLKRDWSDQHQQLAQDRLQALAAEKRIELNAHAERAALQTDSGRMTPARLMDELAKAVPENICIAGEAITAGATALCSFDFRNDDQYFTSRGGGIGQGLPSAIGLKLAYPDRPVMCLSGDGSSLYTIQSLWTAAHHQIPVVWVILNNGCYRILKINMNRFRKDAGIDTERGYPHMALGEPQVDFISVAKGFGVEAQRISTAAELGPALAAALDSGQPWLLDVLVDANS